MDRKHKTGEIATLMIATVAGALLLPVVTPVIMCTNGRWYADEFPWLSCILSDGRFVSSLTAFVYMVVSAAPIQEITFFVPGGGTALELPSVGSDGGRMEDKVTYKPTPAPTENPALSSAEKQGYRPR